MKLRQAVEGSDADLSHPARGAWIEMLMTPPISLSAKVAPRKGCVD